MTRSSTCILVIDDSEDDLLFIQRAFRKIGVKGAIRVVSCGEEAIQYLRGEGSFADRNAFPFPSLLITDLKMPQGDGFFVLENIKGNPDWCVLPVLVMSASRDPDDIKRSYHLSASCYMVKPNNHAELQRLLSLFYQFWIECEMPPSDLTGHLVETNSQGKMGERFSVSA